MISFLNTPLRKAKFPVRIQHPGREERQIRRDYIFCGFRGGGAAIWWHRRLTDSFSGSAPGYYGVMTADITLLDDSSAASACRWPDGTTAHEFIGARTPTMLQLHSINLTPTATQSEADRPFSGAFMRHGNIQIRISGYGEAKSTPQHFSHPGMRCLTPLKPGQAAR